MGVRIVVTGLLTTPHSLPIGGERNYGSNNLRSGNSEMTDHQRSAGPDAVQHRDAASSSPALLQPSQYSSARQPVHGRHARWSDSLRMIAVTAEQLSTVSDSAESAAYMPTVPADSEDRGLD